MNATTDKKARMNDRIKAHGLQLLAIFPQATIKDPVALCKKLRKIEARGAAFALRLCNGPAYTEDSEERISRDILRDVNATLGNAEVAVPVFLNRDPRGYALKIRDEWITEQRSNSQTAYKAAIHQDWGGYGIIAPDLSE